jgi:membrane associated rhomboid family serine protease
MTLSSIAKDLNNMVQSMQANAPFVLALILVALIIYMINCACKNRLNILGIIPRKLIGLPGLICAPWLHASLAHWFMNALFFFLLASMTLMILSQHQFVYLCLFLSVGSGLLTWTFGRRAVHIGASGVVMGLWGYLLVYAIRNPSFIAVSLAIIVLYFLGGMVINLIPKNDKSSWEAHLFGFIAGVAAAFVPLA